MIDLVDATKRYRRPSTDRGLASRWRRVDHVALRDITLSVHAGETVGVLGHNGAGKTTLLRLIGGVTQPTGGSIRVIGHIAPLISVGVGFHQELSGRENVGLNGMLLGLTKGAVLAGFDDIVEFSELADHIDTPVKFYSSGMLMRLAFAVAMHVHPDVLLVDEVLAVGDVAFQRKCLDRMTELQREGTTIVLVSHSVHAIRLLCPRAIVLDHGRLLFDGPSDAAVSAYHDLQERAPGDHEADTVLLDRALLDEAGAEPDELRPGGRYRLRYRLRLADGLAHPRLAFVVGHETGVDAYRRDVVLPEGLPREVEVEVGFTAAMAGGTYRVGAAVLDGEHVVADDRDALVVYLPPDVGSYGIAELDADIYLGGLSISQHREVRLGGRR